MKRIITALLFFATAKISLGAQQTIQPDELVRPADTDDKIVTFDNPHGVYFPEGTSRGELLLFLPGTNKKENQMPGARRFCRNAATSGYNVIFLMYPNDVAAAEACREDADPNAFSDFRKTLIEGGDTRHLKLARSESIENRAIKLLLFLAHEHPDQGWQSFITKDQLEWTKIAVAGQSQGGGHAAWIATRHLVARVLCFGSPKDYSLKLNAPAKWYGDSVTPLERYFAFNNIYDKQGCDYEQLVKNFGALGLDKLGVVDVGRDSPPYHHAHVLFTNWPGHIIDSKEAHGSVIRDSLLDSRGIPIFRPVWHYMLTAPTT